MPNLAQGRSMEKRRGKQVSSKKKPRRFATMRPAESGGKVRLRLPRAKSVLHAVDPVFVGHRLVHFLVGKLAAFRPVVES